MKTIVTILSTAVGLALVQPLQAQLGFSVYIDKETTRQTLIREGNPIASNGASIRTQKVTESSVIIFNANNNYTKIPLEVSGDKKWVILPPDINANLNVLLEQQLFYLYSISELRLTPNKSHRVLALDASNWIIGASKRSIPISSEFAPPFMTGPLVTYRAFRQQETEASSIALRQGQQTWTLNPHLTALVNRIDTVGTWNGGEYISDFPRAAAMVLTYLKSRGYSVKSPAPDVGGSVADPTHPSNMAVYFKSRKIHTSTYKLTNADPEVWRAESKRTAKTSVVLRNFQANPPTEYEFELGSAGGIKTFAEPFQTGTNGSTFHYQIPNQTAIYCVEFTPYQFHGYLSGPARYVLLPNSKIVSLLPLSLAGVEQSYRDDNLGAPMGAVQDQLLSLNLSMSDLVNSPTPLPGNNEPPGSEIYAIEQIRRYLPTKGYFPAPPPF